MTDIRKFAVSQAASRLHLRDAADEPMYADDAKTLPIAVHLFGPGSKQHVSAQTKQTNRHIRLMRRNHGEMPPLTDEQRLEEQAKFLTDCTESFENLEYAELKGEELAKAVYADPTLGFIADQAAKHIKEWANFSTPSTVVSASTSGK